MAKPKRALGKLTIEAPISVPGFASRHLRTYTHAGFDGREEHPLLLLFDGQNVFDDAPSFAGGWRAHSAVDRLAKRRRKPIVVGLDHGGHARIAELSPWGPRGGAGRGEDFLGWVAHTLVPQLRRRFPIVPGPAGVLFGGSSLGGLAALYSHYRFPETVGGALAMSSSLWLGGRKIFDFVRDRPRPWTSQIYLDCGEKEGAGMHGLFHEMGRHFRGRGYDDAQLLLHSDARGRHEERAWRRRLPGALRFFYK